MQLDEAVPAILPLFEKQLETEGISLTVDLDPSAPVLVARGMLSFILTSLISNSIHALIGCPSPTITVRTRVAGGFSSLEVSDTGCGISPEDTPRIFTPFFTTKGEWAEAGSSQARVRGIGLSLSVCQSTVAESGGWIEVESTKGTGTTFRVFLPAAAPEEMH
jgi:signal transduction histidine kinase